jgi:pyridoxine kinase
MAVVLILGSHVASSRVGGTLANLALALSPFEIEPIHVPTTLLGRHPGWGSPGGGAVPDTLFAGMLEGIAANGLFAGIDAVLTNYFASPAQIEIAARAIDAIKAANPKALVVVDPVMGDAPAGLYVGQDIATAFGEHLVPRADYLTPNLWELGFMTGLPTQTLSQVRYAARTLGKATLVTSVCASDGIGAMLVDGERVSLVTHAKAKMALKGTGDLVAALFLGHLVSGALPLHAMAKAIAGVSSIVEAAISWSTGDLPIVAHAATAWASAELPIQTLAESL